MNASRRKALIFNLVGLVVVAAVLLMVIDANHPSLPGVVESPTQVAQVVSSGLLANGLPLRDYGQSCGVTIGAAVDVDALRSEPLYRTTLAREFDLLTPENAMKFRNLSAAPGQYDFTDADALVDFALANDMQIRGHTLIWHQALPDWLESGSFTPDEIQAIFERHIHTLVGRYQGKIAVWDVVNEAVDYTGNLRDSFWLRALGKDYIEMAFRAAHEADPQARLVYNDYNAESINPKSDTIYALMKGFLARGVPINGVAFQMHIGLGDSINWDDVQRNIARLQALGLEVQISEMDVSMQDADLPLTDKLAKQADLYRTAAEICMKSSACTSFSTWGFTDLHTWLPGLTGKPDNPLLFDTNYQPKLAYDALRAALRGCCQSNGQSRCRQ